MWCSCSRSVGGVGPAGMGSRAGGVRKLSRERRRRRRRGQALLCVHQRRRSTSRCSAINASAVLQTQSDQAAVRLTCGRPLESFAGPGASVSLFKAWVFQFKAWYAIERRQEHWRLRVRRYHTPPKHCSRQVHPHMSPVSAMLSAEALLQLKQSTVVQCTGLQD